VKFPAAPSRSWPAEWPLRRPGFAWVTVALTLAVTLLGGCQLEDRSEDPEAGPLRGVTAEPPGPGGDDRPAGEAFAPAPVLELGEAFWHGDDTRAVEISARFISGEARDALLDPQAPVGRFDNRDWRLSEILVAVDYRDGPATARWQVAGPSPLVEIYLAGLEDHPADRSPLSELGVLELEARLAGEPAASGGSTSGR
jgi:hypothetical protein